MLQLLVNPSVNKLAPNMGSWPIYVYGNSYGILAAGWFTSGKHYTQQAAARLGGGSVTSYAISGKRILDVLSALVNQTQITGLATTPVVGGKWPGTSSRSGLVVLESSFNDCGHYATMVGTAVPVALPTANTKYRDTLKKQYEAALALMSSETRIENASFTVSGTWTRAVNTGYSSGGAVDFTTAVGAYCEVSVTPPQRGPLAGKVYLLTYALDAGSGTTSVTTVTVDGAANSTYTPPVWEKYTGAGGTDVTLSWSVIPVTLPLDGAAHTVRFTQAGSAGHILYNDCLLVPSEDPNPIAVMGCELGAKVNLWNASQVAIHKANSSVLLADIKTVVAQFPHAIYVPSTMTAEGLSSGDGIHPNDRGMAQRANDLAYAVQTLRPRLENRALAALGDSNFTVV